MSMVEDARLASVAARQRGVFTRAQAVAAGFSAGQIERRVRAAVWQRVFPRVYRAGATPATVALVRSAAVLWAGPGSALSHTSAAAIWRLGGTALDRPELVVPRSRAPRSAGVVVHRVAGLDDRDVVEIAGLPVTSPVRTLIDLAGVADPESLRGALDAARSHELVTVRALLVRLDEPGASGRPGVSLLRALLAPIGSVRVDRSARMAG